VATRLHAARSSGAEKQCAGEPSWCRRRISETLKVALGREFGRNQIPWNCAEKIARTQVNGCGGEKGFASCMLRWELACESLALQHERVQGTQLVVRKQRVFARCADLRLWAFRRCRFSRPPGPSCIRLLQRQHLP
jgi:hypothetical protein